MERIRCCIKSMFAGIMISVGCIVNLSCDNSYIGALLFCIGLISILLFDFNLYTGKVCYIPYNTLSYTFDVITIFVWNMVGCCILGGLFPVATESICLTKLSYNTQEILIRSCLCGMLIYISVESYKQHNTLLPTLLCVPVFILSGYIHVVADTFYFISAKVFNVQVVVYLALAAIGNAIGGMLIPFMNNTKLMN